MSSSIGNGFVHRRLRILVPLRHRDFRLLWTGMTVSLLGDGITTIALAWQAYEISNTPTAFSMVAFSMAIPQVFMLLFAGAIVDRYDRRKVMLFADVIRMVAVFALGALSIYGQIQIWHMAVIAAFYGVGTAFFGPAFDAIVPDLVPERELTQANSLDQFVRPAVFRMVGPAVGGWLIAMFGGRPGEAFMLDGVTFSISIACLIFMRPHRAVQEGGEESTSMVSEIKEGFRYVRTQVWLWGTFLAATLAYLIFWGPAEVLLPFIVKEEMGRSASDLGMILALGGVGAMLAAVVMANREMPRRHMTFMYVAWTLSTLMIAGYGIARLPWQAMVFCFTFNALESAGLIVWITTKQRLVPARLLGRVSSLDWFISIGLVPLSYALTGPLAAALGSRPTLVVAGLLGGVVTIAFLFVPGMRALERARTLEGVSLEAALDATLDGTVEPALVTGAMVVLAQPNGRGPADAVIWQHQETLRSLRAAIERWHSSRAELHDELETLELEEAQLERRLKEVRSRISTLRGLRLAYETAGADVAPLDAAKDAS